MEESECVCALAEGGMGEQKTSKNLRGCCGWRGGKKTTAEQDVTARRTVPRLITVVGPKGGKKLRVHFAKWNN